MAFCIPTSRSVPIGLPLQPQRRRRGMTLVEVMVAAVVLFIVGAGILGVLIQAYRLTLLTRHSDNARAMLVAFGDQFARNTIPLDASGNPSGMWAPALTNTGVGLSWQTTATTLTGTSSGLLIDLGSTTGSTVPAQVFRQVYYLPTPLTPSIPLTQAAVSTNTTSNIAASGTVTNSDIISATFTILFTVNGQQKTQTLTVARIWRNANS